MIARIIWCCCFMLLLLLQFQADSSAASAASWTRAPRAWRHRHHRLRHNRSATAHLSGTNRRQQQHRLQQYHAAVPFPTSATPVDFQFTAARYNLSVYENSIGQHAVAADQTSAQMVGVWLPRGYHQIHFSIIEGDSQDRFVVTARRIGNFAFLQLEHRDQMDVLNRELQQEFVFTIRATAKRKRGLALEAIATVNLHVLDENDNPPMFKELNYQVEIEQDIPLNSRVVQLEAFDADEGLNGALYYSLVNHSQHFYIEPNTGWVRTFAPLDSLKIPANISLEVRIEDRASRLLYHRQKQQQNGNAGNGVLPAMMFSIRNRATVDIVVKAATGRYTQPPKLHFRQLQFQPLVELPMKVALIRVEEKSHNGTENTIHLELSRLNVEFVWNCAWLDRQNNREFALWLCPPFPRHSTSGDSADEILIIRIAVFRVLNRFNGQRIAYSDQEFQIRADPLIGRKIWLEDFTARDDNPMVISISESFSPGAVLWQFNARINYSNEADRKKIRYKLLQNTQHQQQKFPIELNRTTGQLYLRDLLEFEADSILYTKRQWNLTVVAQLELGNMQKSLRIQSAPLNIQLNLLDANDHCPEFMEIPLGHLIQLEGRHFQPKTPNDNIVWKAKAKDRDQGRNAEIIYKLLDDEHKIFQLDPFTGELRLVGIWPLAIDRSRPQNQIRVKVLAMDRGWPYSHQTQLSLIFQRQSTNNGTTSENAKQHESNFVIGPEMLQSTCQLPNKYAPEFVKPEDTVIGIVKQIASVGMTIGHLHAKDRDNFGANSVVQYWFSPEHDYGNRFFGIDVETGRVFVRQPLDELVNELMQQQKSMDNNLDYLELPIEVLAIDMAVGVAKGRQRSTKRRFQIRILGQNVHAPRFEHYSYRLAIREGNSLGTELLRLHAYDPDLGSNGRVEYRLAVETDLCSVDPDTGIIRAERVMDREELGDEFTLLVMAFDHGTPSKFSFANLTILLDDINDEHPECPQQTHRFFIPEDSPHGHLIGCISAVDRDAPGTKNSEIHFELIQQKSFGRRRHGSDLSFYLDAETGCVFLNSPHQPLNIEQQRVHKFDVKLTDRGSPSLSSKHNCQVEIWLTPVDDYNWLLHHAPHFSEIALEASVEENLPAGTDVLRVHADEKPSENVDKDQTTYRQESNKRTAREGTNSSRICYRLVGGNGFGHFTLEPETGMIRTKKELDFEQHQQFWLTIRAEKHQHGDDKNNGTTNKFTTTKSLQYYSHQHVLVRVLNQNDRYPLFSTPLYRAVIAENSEENKVVLKVEATDADEPQNQQQSQRWEYHNKQNGDGTDNNGGIRYSIMNSEQRYFAIDEHTGYIVSGKHKLDRETQSEHELQVRACDQGGLCTRATVQITVDDLNDCAPKFDAQQLAVLAAPADKSGFVGRLFAVDLDAPGPNSRLKYWLEDTDLVEIDAFGRIFAKQPLKAGAEVEFTVYAEDAGNPPLHGNAIVRMPVLGRANRLTVSNRAPYLLHVDEWRELSVTDMDQLGTVIGTVKAYDGDGDPLWWCIDIEADQNLHAQRIFAFRPLPSGGAELVLADTLTSLDPTIAELSIKFSLTDGVDTVNDKLTVRITRRSATARIHRPTFVQPEITIELSSIHTLPVGYVLHQAQATVSNEMRAMMSNGEVSHPLRLHYALHSADDLTASEVFHIDSSNGNVILETPLPDRLASPFTLIISASLTATSTFTGTINVTNDQQQYNAGYAIVKMRRRTENEYAPMFVQFDSAEEQFVQLLDVSAPGDVLYIAEAVDPDPGVFGKVTYSLLSNPGTNGDNYQQLFSLNASTGELRLAKPWPRRLEDVRLTLRASDSAPVMPKSTKCYLRIVGPKSIRQETEPTRLHYILNKFTTSSNQQQFLGFLNGTTTVDAVKTENNDGKSSTSLMLSTDCAFVLDQNQTFNADECAKLINVHFATGKLFYTGVFTELDEVNCTILLTSTMEMFALMTSLLSEQQNKKPSDGTVLQRFVLYLKFASQEASALRFARAEFTGEIDTNRIIDSPVLSSTLNDGTISKIPLQLEMAKSTIIRNKQEQKDVRFRVLLPRETYFTVDPISGVVRTMGPLQFDELDDITNWEFSVIAQGQQQQNVSSVVGIDTLPLYSQPAVVKIAMLNGNITATTKNVTMLMTTPEKMTKFLPEDIPENLLELQPKPMHLPQRIYNISLRENQTERVLLLSVWPENASFGQEFRFQLIGQASAREWMPAFQIEPTSGLLWLDTTTHTAPKLDREKRQNLLLAIRVFANDQILTSTTDDDDDISNEISFSTLCLVQIRLEDINDNSPEFAEHEYTASISERAKPGDRLVLQLHARDPDVGMNGVVRYKLAEGAPNFLELNKYDGKFTVSANIAQHKLEIGQQFDFDVVAADRGLPSLNSSVHVHLHVVHHAQPVFSHQIYTVTVDEESQKFPFTLITVRAWSNAPGAHIGYQLLMINNDAHTEVGQNDENELVTRFFHMDFENGQLHLLQPVINLPKTFNLTIEAMDITRRHNKSVAAPTGHAQVHVHIRYKQSSGKHMRFEYPIFNWTVLENLPVGTFIGQLGLHPATVVNVSTDAPQFSLFGTDDGRQQQQQMELPFNIDNSNGKIYLVSPLDYEHCQRYEFRVNAVMEQDMGENNRIDKRKTTVATALAQLRVLDANDNWPKFVGHVNGSHGQLQIMVPEKNAQLEENGQWRRPLFLHKFTATDADLNDHNKLRYSLVTPVKAEQSEDESEHFASLINGFLNLDSTNGVLTADWYRLDISQRQQLMTATDLWPILLNISVNDGFHQTFTTTQLYRQPFITQTNNFQFRQAVYTFRVVETSTSIGATLGMLQVQDGKEPYRYEAIVQMIAEIPLPISVDEHTGRIVLLPHSTDRKLSKIRWSRLAVPVCATDSNGLRAFAQLQLEIADDENTHSPEWIGQGDTGYQLAIDQWTAQPGDELLQVLAIDDDHHDRLEYQIIGNTEAEKLLQLNSSTGVLTVRDNNKKLIFPENQEQLDFSIRVSDTANPPHQSTLPVHIQLLPKPDDGATAIALPALFNRVPQFAQLHNLFAVSEDAPVGHRLGHLQIKNENAFVTAGGVHYTLDTNIDAKQQQLFQIDKQTGEIVLRNKLDAEITTIHHFIVRASRVDDPRLSTLALVSITVMDVNDVAPVFLTTTTQMNSDVGVLKKEKQQIIEVPENTAPSTVVAAFIAYDGDVEQTNAVVTYSLEIVNNNSNDAKDDVDTQVDWAIDTEQGWLQVGPGGLDRERRAIYNLHVVATDAGGLKAVQSIQIRVLDVNDSPPRFSQSLYTMKLQIDQETPRIGQILASFDVFDTDEQLAQQQSIQMILWEDPLAIFRIESSNVENNRFHLVLSRRPSRLELPNAIHFPNITLVAYDGLLSSYARLDLELLPDWKQEGTMVTSCESAFPAQTLKIAGNLPVGHSIFTWSTTNSTYRAELFNTKNVGTAFEVRHLSDSAIALVVLADYHRQIDYELEVVLQRTSHNSSKQTNKINNSNDVCLSSDQQFSCVQTFRVHVENANRMAPQFPVAKLVLNVSEDAYIDVEQMKVLTRLEAIDEDWGNFGRITYAFTTNSRDLTTAPIKTTSMSKEGPFWLDPDSGVIGLIGPLDREQRELYSLHVIATDGGGLFGKMLLEIEVLDVNDNAPECAQPLYQAQLFENDPFALNLQLEATDRDRPHNRNNSTRVPSFNFKLPDVGSSDMPEELRPLLNLTADGHLTLANGKMLDYEKWINRMKNKNSQNDNKINVVTPPMVVIEFSVEVLDQDEHRPLSGICRVQLVLLDVNDNTPLFEQQIYEATMRENTLSGTPLLKLIATDADSEHFGHVSYSIRSAQFIFVGNNDTSGKMLPLNHTAREPDKWRQINAISDSNNNFELAEHFGIDDEDGWLRVIKPIDFEQIDGENRLIQLRIRAQDGGQPALESDVLVNIRVLDVNDNAPQIVDCTKLMTVVQEGAPPGHTLLTFGVTDADHSDGNTGPFRFKLNGDGADAFAIDPMHNLITTRQLHFAERQHYLLYVSVFDAGGLTNIAGGNNGTIDNGCPLQIRVQPQSKHSPEVQPLNIELMALYGEFLGGQIGKLYAIDRDPADLLRYSIVVPSNLHQQQSPANDYKQLHSQQRFSVHPETGELFAQADLLPGIHRFNISVTDGKFISHAPISVELIKIDQEALDNSLSIRLRGISAQDFVHLYMRRFRELLARIVEVRTMSNVHFLSLQESGNIGQTNVTTSNGNNDKEATTETITLGKSSTMPSIPADQRRQQQRHINILQKQRSTRAQPHQHRHRHAAQTLQEPHAKLSSVVTDKQQRNSASISLADTERKSPLLFLDVLVAIMRADAGGGPIPPLYYRPGYVRQRMEAGGMAQLFERDASGLEIISLTTEVCRRDTCVRGDCRDRLWLDNSHLRAIQIPASTISFVGPSHVRTFECICRQGYAGRHCDVPVNKCAKELCKRAEICIPSSNFMTMLPSATMILADSPKDASIGFSCACPPGLHGPNCINPICPHTPTKTMESSNGENAECSRQNAAISLLGQGYIELHIVADNAAKVGAEIGGNSGNDVVGNGIGTTATSSVESRMELSIDFRTVSASAVLMHGNGLYDHHLLRIVDGRMQYEWDCGTGLGMVRIGGGATSPRVDDGHWHRIRVLRIGRLAKLWLDGRHRAEGTSPPGSDVLNLFSHSTMLILGARVEPNSDSLIERRRFLMDAQINRATTHQQQQQRLTADELRVSVYEAMIGCIGRMTLDGIELLRSVSNIRLFNAAIGCDERTIGPCLGGPCQNGGQCIPTTTTMQNDAEIVQNPNYSESAGAIVVETNPASSSTSSANFTCQCPSRYTGARCEIDLNACAAHPCPNGIACHNLYGDFHCSCPVGFTGKTCQLRGDWDPCVTAQCGPNGVCVRQKTTFTCKCGTGWTGPFCNEPEPSDNSNNNVQTSMNDNGNGGDEMTDDKDPQTISGLWLWLTDLFVANRLHLLFLLLPICLLLLALIGCTFYFLCCRQQQPRQQHHQSRNRRKNGVQDEKNKKNNNYGTTTLSGSFSKGNGNGIDGGAGGGNRRQKRHRQQQQQQQHQDPANNPLLVPRQTVAPCHGTADRSPPPLPPRYHHHHHRRDANGTALPTVEVKPMPVPHRNVEDPQQKSNNMHANDGSGHVVVSKDGAGSSLKSTQSTNGAAGDRRANCSTTAPTPVPPPRLSSADLSNTNDGIEMQQQKQLRAFGRPLTSEELRQLNLGNNGGVGCDSTISSPNSSPMMATAAVQKQNFQLEHVPTTVNGNNGGNGTSSSYGRKIEYACTAAANTQKQKSKPINGSRKKVAATKQCLVSAGDRHLSGAKSSCCSSSSSPSSSHSSAKAMASINGGQNGDYMTMKPVHRAKPFIADKAMAIKEGKPKLTATPNERMEAESPPPPPRHRTPQLPMPGNVVDIKDDEDSNPFRHNHHRIGDQRRRHGQHQQRASKLYDNPLADPLGCGLEEEEEEDTNGNPDDHHHHRDAGLYIDDDDEEGEEQEVAGD